MYPGAKMVEALGKDKVQSGDVIAIDKTVEALGKDKVQSGDVIAIDKVVNEGYHDYKKSHPVQQNSNCNVIMVGTRNISIEHVIEPHVQNWVNNKINDHLTRFREEVTVTIQNAIIVPLSGPAGDTLRHSDEGTSRGTQPQFTRMIKIEFPKFRGKDVRGWLYKCEKSFEIDQVSDPHKVQLASIYLYDTASLWHRQLVKLMGENASWNSFKKQISFYIAGLQSKVELAVRMFRPKTLAEVYNLSKIQKAVLKLNKQRGQVFNLEVVADPVDTCHDDSILEPGEDTMQEEGTWEIIEFTSQISLHALNALNMVSATTIEGIPLPISNLLSHFDDVFYVPISLPPIREYDHKIVLKKGTEPIFSRPYRHSSTQKDAIKPLTKLLKKNAFVLTEEAYPTFLQLKEAMMNALVLKLPNYKKMFIIKTDASREGIGAVLQQAGYPIAYYSKTLAPRHHKLSTYEKELLAII
nr:gypsy/Ty3 retroelement polyprotein [Tanacetum cinerariifolium]